MEKLRKKKYKPKELAAILIDGMAHDAEEIVIGVDTELRNPKYDPASFERARSHAFGGDPEQEAQYEGFARMAAWVANNHIWLQQDRARALVMLEFSHSALQQAKETAFPDGADTEKLLKGVKTSADDFVLCCCHARVINEIVRALSEYYDLPDLLRLAVPAEEIEKDIAQLEEMAEDCQDVDPVKEEADVIRQYCKILRKAATEATKRTFTEDDEERLLDALGGIAHFDGQAVENAVFGADDDRPQILRLRSKRPGAVFFALDKINSHVIPLWDVYRKDDLDGQLVMSPIPIDVSRRGAKEPVNVLFSMDFRDVNGDVSTTEERTAFDCRVEAAANGLRAAGNDMFSIRQIYHAMGYTGNAGQADIKKIDDSLSKMNRAHIYISNEHEAKRYNKPLVRYDGAMLPMERCSVFINGDFIDGAIHLLREPPLISFAKDRGQIAEVSLRVLQSPLNKTDQSLRIEDYFIREISHMKNNPKFSRKMLFSSVYAYARIRTKKQRQRAPKKIEDLLKHYVSVGYINGYTMDSDSVTLKVK